MYYFGFYLYYLFCKHDVNMPLNDWILHDNPSSDALIYVIKFLGIILLWRFMRARPPHESHNSTSLLLSAIQCSEVLNFRSFSDASKPSTVSTKSYNFTMPTLVSPFLPVQSFMSCDTSSVFSYSPRIFSSYSSHCFLGSYQTFVFGHSNYLFPFHSCDWIQMKSFQ